MTAGEVEAAATPEKPEAALPEARPGRSYMLVRVGQHWLGFEAKSIVEVAVKGAITRVPTAPRHVLGITSLRGGLVPVVSLAQLLEATGSMSTDKGTVTPRLVVVATREHELALVVHEIGGLISREPVKPEAPDRKRPSFLADQVTWEGRTVEIVDLDELLVVATGNNVGGD